MNCLSLILQINEAPGYFARPYDSTRDVPSWFTWVAVIILGYIVMRVFIVLQKDKQKMDQDK